MVLVEFFVLVGLGLSGCGVSYLLRFFDKIPTKNSNFPLKVCDSLGFCCLSHYQSPFQFS